MSLAYVLIFLLHLTASTCDATGRNDHLLFAGRAGNATAPSPAIHYHHHRHIGKVILSDYQNMHFDPAMMAWRGEPTPRPSPSVEAAAVVGGGAPLPPPMSGVEGAPPPPGKQDTSAAMEPSLPGDGEGVASEASAMEHEESASDVDVGVDYAGPKTHPHGPPRPAESIN